MSERYLRQMMLKEVGPEGQRKLRAATILVVGVGGLGCPILSYLAAAGVGHLRIVDNDRVERSNLHRQPLFKEHSVGQPKVHEVVKEITNPDVRIEPVDGRLGRGNVEQLLAGIDIAIDGSDNFGTKYLLNDACIELGLPLISASVFGFEGQLSVFNALDSDGRRGPTYRCLYPEPPLAKLVPSCAETGVLGVLPGIMGMLQATEALKVVLGLGHILLGKLLIYNALAAEFFTVTFSRDERLSTETRLRDSSYYEALNCCPSLETRSISARALKAQLEASDGRSPILIDVREYSEKRDRDIGGEIIPSGEILGCLHRIPRDQPVVLYCQSGKRSAACIRILQSKHGYENLINLEGGVYAWS